MEPPKDWKDTDHKHLGSDYLGAPLQFWKTVQTFDTAVGCQQYLKEEQDKIGEEWMQWRAEHPNTRLEDLPKFPGDDIFSAQCISNGGSVQHANPDGVEYAIQRATCRGWVWHTEEIGGAAICYGEYARALNIIRYRVDKTNQLVWDHDEGTALEPQDGWVPFLTPGRTGVTGSCQVMDARNWHCSVKDQYGSNETEMIGGIEHLRALGGKAPDDHTDLLMTMARCDVQIGGSLRSLSEVKFLLDSKQPDVTDCRKPPA
jgi:hypothetical protein